MYVCRPVSSSRHGIIPQVKPIFNPLHNHIRIFEDAKEEFLYTGQMAED
jgi:hypothetical protein